jgi:hypothetical protein
MRFALDGLLKKLNSPFPIAKAEIDNLLAILERFGQLKREIAADDSLDVAIIEELVARGMPWAEIDSALGVNPGSSWQRLRGNPKKPSKHTRPPLPGRAPNELLEELGIRSTVPIYNRIKKVGPAEWWGYFAKKPDGTVERVTGPARGEGAKIRILDLEAYKAAGGKPGRKPRSVVNSVEDPNE